MSGGKLFGVAGPEGRVGAAGLRMENRRSTAIARKLEKAVRIARFSALPPALRLELLAAPVLLRLSRKPAYARLRSYGFRRPRLQHTDAHAVELDGLRVFVSRDGSLSDVSTFYEIFIANDYETDYRDAIVVDLGAHKGYFGAYALTHGAAAVISYEPESRNFEHLHRARESAEPSKREAWTTRKVAVGTRHTTAQLNVSGDSWTHSLLSRPGRMVDTEPTEVVPMSAILDTAGSLPGGRIVVKIDVEGAECDIILNTPVEAWAGVDELFVELHGFSPCSFDEVAGRLREAGLVAASGATFRPTSEFEHRVFRFRRAQAPF